MKKQKVNKKLMPTQKEKNIFFAGVGVGLVTGLIGNLFISACFYLINYYNVPIETMWFLFALSGLVILIIMLLFFKKIKSVYKK